MTTEPVRSAPVPQPKPFDAVPYRRWLAVGLALAASAAIYLYGLERAPAYLGGDEAHFGVHGYALAQDGHNLDGLRFPLFVNLWDPLGDQEPTDLRTRWYQPMLFYLTAAELTMMPLTEVTVRLPMVLVAAVINPFLMYVIGLRLFRRPALAGVAAVLLVLSPSYFILGRQALDYLLPIPFVLGWLWCVLAYLERSRVSLAFAGGLLLGLGFYSYIAAWIFMPLCLLVGCATMLRSNRGDGLRACLASSVGFALPLAPAAAWLFAHPQMLIDTLSRYQTEGTAVIPIWSRILNIVVSNVWSDGPVRYVSYFDPRMLFVTGGPVLTTSLGRAGVFLLPVAVLLPLGFVTVVRRQALAGTGFVLIAGLLLAPVAAVVAGEASMIQRCMFLLPFAIFLAVTGLARLLDSRHKTGRAVAVALLVALPVQFAYVYRDFFIHYQRRSAFYYDAVAFREAAEYLIAATVNGDAPAILLFRNLDDIGSKWRFYTTKHGRQDLLQRTRYVDSGSPEIASAAPGTLLVLYPVASHLESLAGSGAWQVVRTILDVDHRAASVILRRSAP